MKPASRISVQMFLILVFGILGCQSNSPNSSTADPTPQHSSSQPHFIKPLKSGFNKVFKTEQYIVASEGGTVLVGDEEYGYSSLEFMPEDLTENTTIVFRWDSQSFMAELTPHGIEFNSPVKLTLSFRDGDVSTEQAEALRVWYYNEPEWDLIGGEVDLEEEHVEAYISHFSRYALAAED